MRRLLLSWVAVLCAGCVTAKDVAEPPPPPPPPLGASTARLSELEEVRARALSEGDAFTLEELLDESYRGFSWDGQRRTKAQAVQRLRVEGGHAETHFTLVSDELEPRLYGDFAVVMGRGNLEEMQLERRGFRQVRFTHVWIWRDGRWRMVAAHESLVPKSVKDEPLAPDRR